MKIVKGLKETSMVTDFPKPAVFHGRIEIIDIIRGAALLGILIVNISFFSLPQNFQDAMLSQPEGVNFWFYAMHIIFMEGKMMAVFSVVFGAGIILFTKNKEKTGISPRNLFIKRMVWLSVFGLINAHLLLWSGDILYFYGIIGIAAYFFRKAKPLHLIMIVPVLVLIGFISMSLHLQNIRNKRLVYLDTLAAKEQRVPISQKQQAVLFAWQEIEKDFMPNPEELKKQVNTMKSEYKVVAKYIRKKSWENQTAYLFFQVWDLLVLMLLGMALFKWGFFTLKWTKAQYRKTVWIGYGLGLPMVSYQLLFKIKHLPTPEAFISYLEIHPIIWIHLLDIQKILIALAHISLLILIYQSDRGKRLMNSLKAVGQMAFTNYILHTVICTLLFYGYGFNYFGELEYSQLFLVVISIWIFQMVVCPVWLNYFLFGPMEWLWRCLTYGKLYAFKKKHLRNRI